MEKMKAINGIKHKLVDIAEDEVSKGISTPEELSALGEVVDMIKDLAKAEKLCMEACYYDSMLEENDGRMGYDRWRYSSGRFAPKGRGTYGYTPERMTTDRMMPERRDDGRYGYPTPLYDRMGYQDSNERMNEAVEAFRGVWDDADKDSRKKMKGAIEDLLYQMEQAV